ncbi:MULTISPECIES: cyclic nucleotide-binding domain-containing protein [Streptomyces]|uniref:cyclic nucleotide-binding domain-containing protein n=1 Tax=Streptomyces TaxID=1883 RepID=UPI000CD4E108|nr:MULTISPECIES: cyclic nucleotide-binding domain-containing protein [Streptomyces]
MTVEKHLLKALTPDQRERLLAVGREAAFPQGTRIFEEQERADRFWVIRSGSVTLDLRLGELSRPMEVATLRTGDMLGWSWLFPPFAWDFGAEALSPVRSIEFDGPRVQRLCDEDPEFGYALLRVVAEILAHRVHRARTRLLDRYAPHTADW